MPGEANTDAGVAGGLRQSVNVDDFQAARQSWLGRWRIRSELFGVQPSSGDAASSSARPSQTRHAVALYRVSTAEQGHSGLGLEAQQVAVRTFVVRQGQISIAEFSAAGSS